MVAALLSCNPGARGGFPFPANRDVTGLMRHVRADLVVREIRVRPDSEGWLARIVRLYGANDILMCTRVPGLLGHLCRTAPAPIDELP